MAGTKEGALKAKQTNYEKHGADFYKRIGAIGGKNGHTGGFAANHELAREAGRKGGKRSKRRPAIKKEQ
jgi:general stress protein YciG